MTSTFTPAKGYELPARGDYVDTWDNPLNKNLTTIDQNLGGVLGLTVSGASRTLTPAEAENLWISASGALTQNFVVLLPNTVCGIWVVSNNTTGSFSFTLRYASGGQSLSVPQGSSCVIAGDKTNIALIGGTAFLPRSGGQLTGDLSIAKSGATLNLFDPGVTNWKMSTNPGGVITFWNGDNGQIYQAFYPGGPISTQQLGDLKTYIDNTANGAAQGVQAVVVDYVNNTFVRSVRRGGEQQLTGQPLQLTPDVPGCYVTRAATNSGNAITVVVRACQININGNWFTIGDG
jgi:hypothetical protein